MGDKTNRLIVFAVVILLIGYGLQLYKPLPPDFCEPWKARSFAAIMETVTLIGEITEFVGIHDNYNMTRGIVNYLGYMRLYNYDGLEIIDTKFGGIPVRLYIPKSRELNGPGIFFIHGGGWVLGGVEIHDNILVEFARRTNMFIVTVIYSLSPEYVYPKALLECYSAYKDFIENKASTYNVDSSRLAFMGDSAGGNLVAALNLKLRDEGYGKLPKNQLLLYPILQAMDFNTPSNLLHDGAVLGHRTDLAMLILLYFGQKDKFKLFIPHLLVNNHTSLEFKRSNMHLNAENILSGDIIKDYKRPVEGNGNKELIELLSPYVEDPYCMPLMAANLSKLPATFVVTAEYDMIRDDGLMFAERLRRAGNRVQIKNYEYGYHGVVALFDFPIKTKVGQETITDIVNYLVDEL